ncbi:class I SAM-dependent methyltransferase [Paraburkholderia ginsengisoli]|uniref:SAM-dependent methyltransferase n=1 Tax=Paraburkholderia ginsengisoli TaxID=311231 RepID=A0A7T4N0K9_9BURK|nr:SAM-dependent methyltransferase [Paraburkholderia ginsengisoli]QQC63009.1 SAM-dependent methyltransferase [Paraburkholderia ginsengisoli]
MLREIFNELENGCDKFEHYFDLYEQHFRKYVGRSPRILEIGCQFGGSAEMWRKYFGAGTMVHGVDIAAQCVETDYLKLFVGDQGSHAFWDAHFGDKHNYYDIVIDDGSHDNPHQITSLLRTYSLLKDGGTYWCEDTHTSYYYKVRVSDGGYKNPHSFTEFCKDVVDVLSSEHTRHAIGVGPIDGPRVPPSLIAQFDRLQGIHFYDSVIVMNKGPRLKFERVIHRGRR